MSNIAFLGTGIMGAPMVRNLLRAGHSVTAYNRTRAKAEPLASDGAKIADTPAEAARDAEYVITIVTDGPDVESVLFGPAGVVESAKPGTLLIDMSTISPAVSQEIAHRATEKDLRTLDAPVTGGEPGAINATLSIMVGGEQADLAEARPIFEALGKTITYCGGHGAGQIVKLCNQICGAMNLLGVCEALVLGQKAGIDSEVIASVISAGAGASWAMQNLAPKINRGDYAPGFMIDTQQKDMRLVAELAEETTTPLLGASLAQQLWRSAQVRGFGREGIQSMVKVVAELARLPEHQV